MLHTPEHFKQAVQFYESIPTGQYDDEAAHALRCHFDLLAACEAAARSLTAARKYFAEDSDRQIVGHVEDALKILEATMAKGETPC